MLPRAWRLQRLRIIHRHEDRNGSSQRKAIGWNCLSQSLTGLLDKECGERCHATTSRRQVDGQPGQRRSPQPGRFPCKSCPSLSASNALGTERGVDSGRAKLPAASCILQVWTKSGKGATSNVRLDALDAPHIFDRAAMMNLKSVKRRCISPFSTSY